MNEMGKGFLTPETHASFSEKEHLEKDEGNICLRTKWERVK